MAVLLYALLQAMAAEQPRNQRRDAPQHNPECDQTQPTARLGAR